MKNRKNILPASSLTLLENENPFIYQSDKYIITLSMDHASPRSAATQSSFITWIKEIESPDKNPYKTPEDFLREKAERKNKGKEWLETIENMGGTPYKEYPDFHIYPVYYTKENGIAFKVEKELEDLELFQKECGFAGFIYTGDKRNLDGDENDVSDLTKIFQREVEEYARFLKYGERWFARIFDKDRKLLDIQIFYGTRKQAEEKIKDTLKLTGMEEVKEKAKRKRWKFLLSMAAVLIMAYSLNILNSKNYI